MHGIINNFEAVRSEIYQKNKDIKIIAVSKTFQFSKIKSLVEYGHEHFGENKVQEAVEKWTDRKNQYPNLKLHMIGKLQTNKVKHVVPIFDYIHSLDNLKLAEKISIEQQKLKKSLKLFIQVNIGNEPQKSGVETLKLKSFYDECVNNLALDIIGLMCIPPNVSNVNLYFAEMEKLNNELGLKELSMGMSSDYSKAIDFGSTYVRIGSKIFGERT